MSGEKVVKYFEVRLYSLALVAITISLLCIFLFFLFISWEEYFYAIGAVALMLTMTAGVVKLFQHARAIRKTAES